MDAVRTNWWEWSNAGFYLIQMLVTFWFFYKIFFAHIYWRLKLKKKTWKRPLTFWYKDDSKPMLQEITVKMYKIERKEKCSYCLFKYQQKRSSRLVQMHWLCQVPLKAQYWLYFLGMSSEQGNPHRLWHYHSDQENQLWNSGQPLIKQ